MVAMFFPEKEVVSIMIIMKSQYLQRFDKYSIQHCVPRKCPTSSCANLPACLGLLDRMGTSIWGADGNCSTEEYVEKLRLLSTKRIRHRTLEKGLAHLLLSVY